MPTALRSAASGTLPAWAEGLQLSRLADLETAQGDRDRFSTGHAPLDHALGGGLTPGSLTECSGPATASLGLTTLQHRLLLSARRRQHFVALIDAFDRFDPDSCPPALRDNLLWIRCEGGVPQALKAADLLVRDPNFGLLLLDLRDAEARALRRVPAPQWYRLQRAFREGSTVGVAFTPSPVVLSAGTRLQFQPPASTASEPYALQWSMLRHSPPGATHRHAAAM